MEQICCTCLSTNRDLTLLNSLEQVYQVFKLLTNDYPEYEVSEMSDVARMTCWECVALMKRFMHFKRQVYKAQRNLKSRSREVNYQSYKTLSNLGTARKNTYDRVLFESEDLPRVQQSQLSPVIAQVTTMKVEPFQQPQNSEDSGATGADVMDFIDDGTLSSGETHTELIMRPPEGAQETNEPPSLFLTETITEAEVMKNREEAKLNTYYARSKHKCGLCICCFHNQRLLEEHLEIAHRETPGCQQCKICSVYVEQSLLSRHVERHYMRYICKFCDHVEFSVNLMEYHLNKHAQEYSNGVLSDQVGNSNVVNVGIASRTRKKTSKSKHKESTKKNAQKPEDPRRLLSKITIQGYKCLECDMFFKDSRARKRHVNKLHREGMQCDHCGKKYFDRGILINHIRLHLPLPRKECPICHKMVRIINLKNHINHHEKKSRFECVECNKVFSYYTTYQGHLKYSRAHATEQVLKFPCPMCNKGFRTKETMQDHFNYQHLGKTKHKCLLCDKLIASRMLLARHMREVHNEKKPKPRNHICHVCGRAFTDRKSLIQHVVIHSPRRGLACDLCEQTFRQKSSLYTHRKRVHKVQPAKKEVEYIEKPAPTQ